MCKPLWTSMGVNAGIKVYKMVPALTGGHTCWQRREMQIFQKTEPRPGAEKPVRAAPLES